jgi:peroxiredoxin Q/BCP
MLSIGQPAPDFELPDHAGETVRLSELLARGPVVVAFYPADFTPVCTAQACMMRDEHERLTEAGLTVVAISPQPAESKARFRDKHDLARSLLADPDRAAIKAFGVGLPLGLVRRATFLIDPTARSSDRVVADLRVGPHTQTPRKRRANEASEA